MTNANNKLYRIKNSEKRINANIELVIIIGDRVRKREKRIIDNGGVLSCKTDKSILFLYDVIRPFLFLSFYFFYSRPKRNR